MTRQSAYELLIGALLLLGGIAVEATAPAWWAVGWIHGVVLQCAGAACLIDAIIRPADPPSRVLIGMAMLAYAWMLSP